MTSIQTLFHIAMDRTLPDLLEPPEGGRPLDLGASGVKQVAEAYGLPEWSFPRDPIPAGDGTVAMIHAYHFLEHLTGEDAIALLKDAQRVLMPGGVFQFCMPYYNSCMQAHDLTHKSFWCEDSFKILFKNPYYDLSAGEVQWEFDIHCVFIMGIVERNMAVMGQLVKRGNA